MRSALIWLKGLASRRLPRILGLAFCVALAVALFASLGMFFTSSRALMTERATASLPVDWQVQLGSGANLNQTLAVVRSTVHPRAYAPVGYADVVSFAAKTGTTVQTTGSGKALGIPDGYATTLPGQLRHLTGESTGVLLAQQTAANLQVGPGDTISMRRPGLRAVKLRVDGVVDLPNADSVFQTVGAPSGAGATAPPDNVVLMPLSLWHTLFDPVAKTDPSAIHTQIHLTLPRDLPRDPALAYTDVVARARHLEAVTAGSALVGNNLAAVLDAARADAVYSQLLFLFLGVPGIVLAWLLATVVGASGHDRRRREQALLRLRGATPGRVVSLAGAEAALVAVLGVVLGLGMAWAAGTFILGAASFGANRDQALSWALAAVALGVALGAWAIVMPAWRDSRLLSVSTARSEVGEPVAPLWARFYLDLVLLGASGLVFWQSLRQAYQVVLVPEGVPTISVNYLTLLAPIMFWIGAALLAWRLADVVLRRGRAGVGMALRPVAGNLASVAAASMRRQRHLLSRSLLIMALTVSFALSVALFNTTYAQQARVDAELTNGADVSVISGTAGLPPTLLQRVRDLPGVAAAQPMQHRYAYVGSDLQDLFGIDPSTIAQATPMSDAFFHGGSAAQTLSRLASIPNGILVSEETARDFQLQPGDTVRIRLQGADGAYRTIPFKYVGIGREFPTAPRDSFLVANSSYVARATGLNRYETLLVKASASPISVAGEVRKLLGPVAGASVHDVQSELKVTLSALTAIDLTGLTKIELTFAVMMAIAASGVLLILGFAERRRTFAIAQAVGARRRQLASFVWSEALFVNIGGVLIGAATGWLLSTMIVRILTGVFDPPPQSLAVPWGYLAVIGGAVVVSVVVAAEVAIAAAAKPAISVIRDL
jgi:putative ABC transport system permease protein